METIYLEGGKYTKDTDPLYLRVKEAMESYNIFSRVDDGLDLDQEVVALYYSASPAIDFKVTTKNLGVAPERFLMTHMLRISEDMFVDGKFNPSLCERVAQNLIRFRRSLSHRANVKVSS